MMRTISLATLLLVTSLAGCLAGDPQSTTSTETQSSAPSTTATTTTSGPPSVTPTNPSGSPNAPPTANLTSDVPNGTVPLNVTFSLSGTDEDGDALTWTLDFGDGNETNGTSLPVAVTHQYTYAQNFSVNFTVTDGASVANASLVIRAELVVVSELICHREPTEEAEGVYLFDGDGGTWVFMESNDLPGLQVGNTHPSGEVGQEVGEYNPAWVGCENADTMLF